MRKITDDDIRAFDISMNGITPEEKLNEKYPYYICRNTYRKLKDSENNWIKIVEIVFSEIIGYLMDKLYEDSWIFLFMEGSSVGRELKNGDYAWQKLSEESKMKIIDFNRYQHKQRSKQKKEAAFENVPDYMKDDSNQQKSIPVLSEDHPLHDPYVLIKVDKELDLRIVREKRNRLVVFICAISAFLCEKPLGAAGLGPSSVGKNMVFDTVLKHIPEKEPDKKENPNAGWFHCNNIKEAALFRLDPKFINHTVVYLGETPDKPTETHLELMGYLRQLQSEGKIAKTLSEQIIDETGAKNWSPKTYKLEAEVSYFALSVFGFEEQFGNRQIPLSFDESEEQTHRIGKWKAEIEKYGTRRENVYLRKTKSEYIEKVIKGISEFCFEQYKDYAFENPYANHVEYILQRLYSGSIQYRRVITYVFRFIETITRLHILNREVEFVKFGKESYRLVATSEDNLLGLYLLWPSLQQAIEHITREDIENLDKMEEVLDQEREKAISDETVYIKLQKNAKWEEENEEEWFSTNNMANAIGKGKDTIRDSCRRLQKAGYLKARSGSKAGTWFKYSISEGTEGATPSDPADILPFLLPPDSPVCLLSLRPENCYSMIGAVYPRLFSLFRHTRPLVGTIYNCVLIIYHQIVYGSIENISEELEEIFKEDFNEKNDADIHTNIHTYRFSGRSDREVQGLARLITEYRQSAGSLGVDNSKSLEKKSSKKKKVHSLEKLIEIVVLNYQESDVKHSGLEEQEIIEAVNNNGYAGTDEDIREKIHYLIQKSILYETRPGKLRLMI